jgi:CO/xanthine dehydrogenase Mo-binding subunit
VYAAIAAAIDDALGCRGDGVVRTPIRPDQVARLAAGTRP